MSTMNFTEDEINLYDYLKVIVKRKRLIIGLFLVATITSAIISFLMPEIYRGEVVLKLPTKEIKELTAKELTAKELINAIGKIDVGKNILPTTHHLVSEVKLNAMNDSTDKLQLIIEAKNVDILPQAFTEFVAYLNSTYIVKQLVDEERQRLIMQIKEINKLIKNSDEIKRTYKKQIEGGRIIVLGFNPIELEKRIFDLNIERFTLEQGIKRIKGVEMISSLSIPKKSVKPKKAYIIAIAGIVSLFVGIFLAFFIEYIEKMKNKSEQ